MKPTDILLVLLMFAFQRTNAGSATKTRSVSGKDVDSNIDVYKSHLPGFDDNTCEEDSKGNF
jgi:hypothetical protein